MLSEYLSVLRYFCIMNLSKAVPYSDLALLLAAAGSGNRFGGDKLWLDLDGMPVWCRSLSKLVAAVKPGRAVVICPAGEEDRFSAAWRMIDCEDKFLVRFVAGGKERWESVNNGLKCLDDGCKLVAIHDAARPLAGMELLELCVEAARSHGAAIPARRVVDTIKRVNNQDLIEETLERSNLVAVETPQVFELGKLNDARRQLLDQGFTDEAGLLEKVGLPVKIVCHNKNNMKITYPEDMILIMALWNQKS